MKKLLFITIILLPALIKAQQYVPFPDSNAIWSEYHQPPLFSGDTPYYYRNAITNKDTVFNTKTYHRIFYSLTDSTFTNPANYYYIGGLRENNKQIFFIPKDSINEYLIYDFSKNVGDTIRYDYSIFSISYGVGPLDTFIVSSIDSILLNDGTYRKRINLSDVWGNPIFYSQWIEGIGHNMGLLFPAAALPTNGINNYLVCYKQNGNEIYFNHFFNTCFPLVVNISQCVANNNIIVSPNPVEDYCTIKWRNSNNMFYKILISDVYGRIIYLKNIEYKNEINIDCGNFEHGFYLINIINNSGFNLASKILIL